MRYIYSNSKLFCIDNISLVEIEMNDIVITLNSGRKISVYSSMDDSDRREVFRELSKEIRCSEDDIDMWEFQNHLKYYNGVDNGTWFL